MNRAKLALRFTGMLALAACQIAFAQQKGCPAPATLASLEAELVQLRATYKPTHPKVIRAQEAITRERARISASPDSITIADKAEVVDGMRRDLARLRTSHKEQHPDVVALKAKLAECERSAQ